MWKVGHSLIKTKMKEEKAVLAGEMSGHMFFADRWFGFDDAVYAAARVVELLSRSDKPLSAIVDALPVVHNTPEIRVECSDDIKFEVVQACPRPLQGDVFGGRRGRRPHQFAGGWGLVRASNTGAGLGAPVRSGKRRPTGRDSRRHRGHARENQDRHRRGNRLPEAGAAVTSAGPRHELYHEIFGSILDRTEMTPYLLLRSATYQVALRQATRMMGNRGFDTLARKTCARAKRRARRPTWVRCGGISSTCFCRSRKQLAELAAMSRRTAHFTKSA